MNSPYFVPFFFAGLGILFVVILLVSRHLNARRRAAFEAAAHQAGWTFAPDDTEPDFIGLGAFPLFARGRHKRVSNLARGSDGSMNFAVFDYRFTTGSGKSQHTSRQTVVHVRAPRLALPPFEMSPENIFHKIGQKLGYHDIDFDSNPEFSSQYLLRSKEHEDSVRMLFTPSVLAYFAQHPTWSLEGRDDQLLFYRNGRQAKTEDLRSFVEEALAAARQLER